MMLSMDVRVQLVNIVNAGDEFFGSHQGLPFLNMTCWPYSCVQMLSRMLVARVFNTLMAFIWLEIIVYTALAITWEVNTSSYEIL